MSKFNDQFRETSWKVGLIVVEALRELPSTVSTSCLVLVTQQGILALRTNGWSNGLAIFVLPSLVGGVFVFSRGGMSPPDEWFHASSLVTCVAYDGNFLSAQAGFWPQCPHGTPCVDRHLSALGGCRVFAVVATTCTLCRPE